MSSKIVGTNSQQASAAPIRGFTAFRNAEGELFVSCSTGKRAETLPLKSEVASVVIRRALRQMYGRRATSTELRDMRDELTEMAHLHAPRVVHIRTAYQNGKIYIDLADELGRVVEVSPSSWKIITNPPVNFLRPTTMLPLPEPVRGGSLNQIGRHLNLATEEDKVLVQGYILEAFSPTGPRPILWLSGEQGSAKSTGARIIVSLIDPNSVPTTSVPSSEENLILAAKHAHMLAFDNVSTLSKATSDMLCQIATGAGFTRRKLYTNGERVAYSVRRPVLINGINDVVDRPDLADRCISIRLAAIEGGRRTEAEVLAAFEAERPAILGAVCDALVMGLTNWPSTQPSNLPRMADFAYWVIACEPAFATEGTFLAAYNENRARRNADTLAANPTSVGVQKYLQANGPFEGTASDLLTKLSSYFPNESHPRAANALSEELHRLAPLLREIGITVGRRREVGPERPRLMVLSHNNPMPDQSSADDVDDVDDGFSQNAA